VGTSPSTKIVVPMELGGLLNGLRGMLPADPPVAAPAADLTVLGDEGAAGLA